MSPEYKAVVVLLVTLGCLILARKGYFLLIIPFLPYSGLWLRSGLINSQWMFISCYLEFIFLFGFLLYYFMSNYKDRISSLLFIIPITALPSLFYSKQNYWLSLWVFFLLWGGSGLYIYFKKHMDFMNRAKLVDLTVLCWSLLTVFIKYYEFIKFGGLFLEQRSGGMWASNSAGLVLLMMMPLARDWRARGLATLALLLSFSRGIYICLIIYYLGSYLAGSRNVRKNIIYITISILAFWFVLGANSDVSLKDYFLARFASENVDSFAQFRAEMLEKLENTSRWDIFDAAVDMTKMTGGLGVGLGGFSRGLLAVGRPPVFSNAHNLYLTSLSEGGVAFFVSILAILGYLLYSAFRSSTAAFISVINFLVYGFYSGELYEVAGGFGSAFPYYYLIFLMAYVEYYKTQGRILRKGLVLNKDIGCKGRVLADRLYNSDGSHSVS